MTVCRVSKQGRIAIPKGLREKLGLKPGDLVVLEIKDDTIVLRKPTLDELLEESLQNYQKGKTLSHDETFRDLV